MVDLGAVGVDPDPSQWVDGTDYSHVSRAFEDVYLADPPYIDQAALAVAYDDWEDFLAHSVANGYNAVSWPGFVEFATFADVPDGPVYPEGDPHVARALALREAFGPFWDRAAELGVKIFLRTDMPTLTPELDDYFEQPLRRPRHREPRVLGGLHRRPRRAVRRGAGALRHPDPHRRGRQRLSGAGLGLLLRDRGAHGRRRADDARDVFGAGRGDPIAK